MTKVRFVTVRDLYESFPTAVRDVGEDATDDPSVEFVRAMAQQSNYGAALSYCAYLLPRREAVWWSIACVRQVDGLGASEKACLDAAEVWVRNPDEAPRRRALELGMAGNTKLPATWVALAAGWSGGSMAPSDAQRLPVAPQLTAQAVRVALMAAAPRLAFKARDAAQQAWIDTGLRYAVADAAIR